MPRRKPPDRESTVGPSGPKSAIEKRVYMTRDAVRRLRLARKAAKAVLAGGGTVAEAAAAAQAHGTPAADGESSDAEEDEEDDDEEDALTKEIEEMTMAKGSAEADSNGPSLSSPVQLS